MKKLIFLSTFLLSPMTFAQLTDKGLICFSVDEPENLFKAVAFNFFESSLSQMGLVLERDEVTIHGRNLDNTYESTSDEITWRGFDEDPDVDSGFYTSEFLLDRKSLGLKEDSALNRFDSLIDDNYKYSCEVFENTENLFAKLNSMQDEAQAQYNEGLKGNKI